MKTTEKKQTVTLSMVELKNHLMVSPTDIMVDEKLNPRQEYGEVEELMNSIIENGLRNPVKVFKKDGKLHLREGFRRMRAVNLAIKNGNKIERVPVLIDERTLTNEERTLEFLINNDGKPFTMLEQADVIGQLLKFGWKITEVVKRTGKARGYIENLILLTRLPKIIENYIRTQKISAHAVIQILREVKQDEAMLLVAVEEAIKEAAASGKGKATPKHLKTNKVKKQSFGKFYKFASEIADSIAGRKDVYKDREDVLSNLLVCFENGQLAAQVAVRYFLDKSKKVGTNEQSQSKPSTPKNKNPTKKNLVNKKGLKK
jgi:ParB/RepB/Spo0J family partition protein